MIQTKFQVQKHEPLEKKKFDEIVELLLIFDVRLVYSSIYA